MLRPFRLRQQRVIERDLFERHPFSRMRKEDCEVDQTVGDELGGAAGECGEHERRPRMNIANVCRKPVLPAVA